MLKLSLVVAGVALAAGCSSGPASPQVTFYSHGQSTTAPAARYCDPTGTHCTQPPQNPVAQLPIPADSPIQISVPQQVYSAPWQVAFVYLGKNGKQLQGRTQVFAPNTQYAYTLRLPADGSRFEHVEVQIFSGVITADPRGGLNFGIGGSWLLNTR
jgi:hypothetical protein